MSDTSGSSGGKGPLPVWAWVAIAVAAVALIGGLWWFLSGNKVEVPEVTGGPQAVATQMLQSAGLKLGAVSKEATDAVVGSVISQSPAAGSKVDKGTAVDLVISNGPDKVAVPDLKGLTRSEALKALSEAGMTSVQTAEYDAYVAKDTVIDQLPAAGEKVAPGSAVGMLVSLGARPVPPVAVPDVKGKREPDARAILTDAGLNPHFVTANNDTVPSGTVVEQSPVGGVKVAPDTEILVLVSAGAAPPTAVAVPNVVGKQNNAAVDALTKAGLRGKSFATYSTKPKGEVLVQEPKAGSKVASGTVIGMLISAGPAPTKPPTNPPTYPEPPVDTPKPDEPIIETVQVPEVTGLTEDDAATMLRDKGLEAVVILYSSDEVPKGKVIAQLPKAGNYVPKGYSILLMVSTGPAEEEPGEDAPEQPAEEPAKQ